MKARQHISLGSVAIAALLIGACADQKGFKAKVTTREDVLRAYQASGKPLPAGFHFREENNFDQIGIRSFPFNEGSRSLPILNEDDAGVYEQFAEMVQSAISPSGEASKADPKMVQKLVEINEALAKSGTQGSSIVKGMDVSLKDVSAAGAKANEKRFELNLDVLVAAERDVVASGKAVLTTQDVLQASRIVEVTLKSIDAQGRQVKLNGFESYATCMKDTCENVQIMILATRQDNEKSKVAVVGVFSFDGQGKGSSLGNKLKSVKQAQDELGQERAAIEQVRKDEETRRALEAQAGASAGQTAIEGSAATSAGSTVKPAEAAAAASKAKTLPEKAPAAPSAPAASNSSQAKASSTKSTAKSAVAQTTTPLIPAGTRLFPTAEDMKKATEWRAEQAAKAANSGEQLIQEIKLSLPRKVQRAFIPGRTYLDLKLELFWNIKSTRQSERVWKVSKTLTDEKLTSNSQENLLIQGSVGDLKKAEVYGTCVAKGCQKFKLSVVMIKADSSKVIVNREYTVKANGEATFNSVN